VAYSLGSLLPYFRSGHFLVAAGTVEAAQKMGELLLQIQKATPNNNPYHENRDTSNLVKSKLEITSEQITDITTSSTHPDEVKTKLGRFLREQRPV